MKKIFIQVNIEENILDIYNLSFKRTKKTTLILIILLTYLICIKIFLFNVFNDMFNMMPSHKYLY